MHQLMLHTFKVLCSPLLPVISYAYISMYEQKSTLVLCVQCGSYCQVYQWD